ncbi:MAG: ribonuclease R [Pseudomonadales bacterium]|nr:ribonuclease R [Pseudomonadales bacterium]
MSECNNTFTTRVVKKKKQASNRRERGATRYTSTEVRNLIANSDGQIDWRDLVEKSGADSPRDITQLRQMLKGLERSGEISKDLGGLYHLVGAEQALFTGLVEQAGSRTTVDGHEMEKSRVALRAGDKIAYTLVGDRAVLSSVVEHSSAPVIGILNTDSRFAYVEGLGKSRRRIELDERPGFGRHGDTVSVLVTGLSRRGLRGVVTDVLESGSVLDQAIETAIAAFEIPFIWPDSVLSASGKLPKTVQPGRFKDRVDLTDLPLVTIDGETAKDFDDAVYAEPLTPGSKKGGTKQNGWRLIVAIADVAHYVKAGGPFDQEALVRGTSVYFPERVIPMLPEIISNELCSLKPEVHRLALVCEMQISSSGKVLRHDFYEALIYSHARLTYTEVEKFLNGKKLAWSDAVTASITALQGVYEALRDAREKRGALDFPTHEGSLRLENGAVADVTPVERLVANQLIEEAMIAANVSAAQFLEKAGLSSLYRVHEPPDNMKLDELRQMLSYAGVRLAPGEIAPKDLQEALLRLPKTANLWLYGQLTLRTMQQAVYTPNNQGHYGLALQEYMHFTSPIRRYPDLLVHRALKSLVSVAKKKPTAPNADELAWLGEQTSQYERRAESAGWMVDGWLKCDYLSNQVGEVLDGLIAAVTDFGLFVELEGYFVQGLLHVSSLGGDYYHFNARSMSLVGEKNGRRFVMGDKLRVRVQSVEPTQGKIDLLLESSPNGKGQSNAGNRGSRGRGKGRRR